MGDKRAHSIVNIHYMREMELECGKIIKKWGEDDKENNLYAYLCFITYCKEHESLFT